MSFRCVKVNSDSLVVTDDAVTQLVVEAKVGMGKEWTVKLLVRLNFAPLFRVTGQKSKWKLVTEKQPSGSS